MYGTYYVASSYLWKGSFIYSFSRRQRDTGWLGWYCGDASHTTASTPAYSMSRFSLQSFFFWSHNEELTYSSSAVPSLLLKHLLGMFCSEKYTCTHCDIFTQFMFAEKHHTGAREGDGCNFDRKLFCSPFFKVSACENSEFFSLSSRSWIDLLRLRVSTSFLSKWH